MIPRRKDASSVAAEITRQEGGGFVAVASTGDVDRDGEVIRPGCFDPLPTSIPVHLDHTMSAASLVGRGRPYYEAGRLMLDASLASTADAQVVRQKIADGVIDSLSIVFRSLEWRDVDGVRTCVRGELLAADLVSVPSQPNARILSMRGYERPHTSVRDARTCLAGAIATLAEIELASAKRLLREIDAPQPAAVKKPDPTHAWTTQVVLHELGRSPHA